MTSPATPEAWCQLAQSLLQNGAALMAYDAASSGLHAFPGHLRLRQLLALALARAGASEQANVLLRALRDAGYADEETLGMLARTHKDLAALSTAPDERRHHLECAHQAYVEAHQQSGGYWSGINVATTALLLGDRDDAGAAARRVRAHCTGLRHADPARADLYWVLATLGEASLILGERRQAEDWYTQAARIGRNRIGDLVSTRRNARLILRSVDEDTAGVDACFAIPRVVAFAGHLIDLPTRTRPRFPHDLAPAVEAAVRERLARIGAGFGFASAACGADIIFLEAIAEAGAKSHIVLPYNREQFIRNSVDIVPDTDWVARFDAALARAADVVVASDHPMNSGGASYEYAFRLLDGLAGVRADELDTDLVCLAVWDGELGDGVGGTTSAVEHWRRRGRTMEVIDLVQLRTGAGAAVVVAPPGGAGTRPAAPPAPPMPRFEPKIVALLFADAPGFSKLTDLELPLFVDRYLGLVRHHLEGLALAPLLVNTWGDGIYIAFESVRDAGVFALGLCDAVVHRDWKALGFGSAMSIRIGLHAGPAYACIDPVTDRTNYIGAHVSRAARIEPITPPGAVYASDAFAALARADGVEDFTCTYVGPTPLAKGYGTFPTFLVRGARTRPPSASA